MRRAARLRVLAAALAPGAFFVCLQASFGCFGCSSSKPQGTLAIVLGGETDALSRDPAVTALQIDAIDEKGFPSSLGHAQLPAATIDLGDLPQDRVAIVRVTGTDKDGLTRVRGASPPVQLGGLDGSTLSIFVQRTGELARFPAPLSDGREAPLIAPLQGRYIFVAGGDTTSQIYDLSVYSAVPTPPKLTRTPKSLAVAGTLALVVDDQGATWFDLSSSATSDAAAPQGGSFAEVAGGASVRASDGTIYVVGATRLTGDASARVLRVDPGGTLSFVTLSAPRLGAAAGWMPGRGLVVAGGNASAPGAEIVGPGATSGIALPYPSDQVTGAGLSPLDDTHLVLTGGLDSKSGDGGLRTLDVTCATACAIVPWPATLPTPLTRAQAFPIDVSDVLVVGDDAAGNTHVVHVNQLQSAEVALRAPRRNARAMSLSTGAIVVVGGGAGVIESYVP